MFGEESNIQYVKYECLVDVLYLCYTCVQHRKLPVDVGAMVIKDSLCSHRLLTCSIPLWNYFRFEFGCVSSFPV